MTGKKNTPGPPKDIDGLCIPQCKYNGRFNEKPMIRCCLCMTWLHEQCLNFPPDEFTGIWICCECRELPRVVNQILNVCTELRDQMKSLNLCLQEKSDIIANQANTLSMKELTIINLEGIIQQKDQAIKEKDDKIMALQLQDSGDRVDYRSTYRDALLNPVPTPRLPTTAFRTPPQLPLQPLPQRNSNEHGHLRPTARVFYPKPDGRGQYQAKNLMIKSPLQISQNKVSGAHL